MPRDAYLISEQPITVDLLVDVAAGPYPQHTMRALEDGIAVQIVGDDYRAVLTLLQGRALRDGDEVARLVPHAPPQAGPVWLTQAWTPWTGGEVGSDILQRLALAANAVLVVEDGS